jgi:hypothetical protein
MPDISMCHGAWCPKKAECFRFTATPGYRQAYTDFDKVRGEDSVCRYFWPVEKEAASAEESDT